MSVSTWCEIPDLSNPSLADDQDDGHEGDPDLFQVSQPIKRHPLTVRVGIEGSMPGEVRR